MNVTATIATDDLGAAVAALQKHEEAEVRLDCFWPQPPSEEDATRVLEAITSTKARVTATLRPKRQGGRYDGPEDVRLSLLVAAARAGCHLIDLEADHGEIAKVVGALRQEADILVSDHRLQEMPSRDQGMMLLQRMQDLQTEHEKLAVPCGSFMESLRALELTWSHRVRGGKPAIASLGGGAPLRALLALAGNTRTYGHAEGLKPAVPGQPAARAIESIWDQWGLDQPGSDGWLAVLGDPVDHSLSPRIHNGALRMAGIPWRYGALQVPDSIGAMRLLTGAAARIGLRGASVTSPLKQHAALVAQCDERAQRAGAANCLRFAHGVEATNTDVAAFETLLAPHREANVLVLGAGGAARAALAAAKTLGVHASFTSRDAQRAEAVGSDLGATWIPWDAHGDTQASIIIQATTARDATVVPASWSGVEAAMELVYANAPTAFEAAAAAADVPVVSGRTFLVEQAVHAFAYWTGKQPDRSAMEAAL